MRPIPFCTAGYVSLFFPVTSVLEKRAWCNQPCFQLVRHRLQQCPIDVRDGVHGGSLLMTVPFALSGTGTCQGAATSGRHHHNGFLGSGRK